MAPSIRETMKMDTPEDNNVIPDYEPGFQLSAISELLSTLRGCRDAVRKRIDDTDYSALPWDPRRDYYVEDLVEYTYVDAAFSQAAVGALAPLMEGILTHEFRSLGVLYGKLPRPQGHNSGHHRWRLKSVDFWNPHKVSDDDKPGKKKKDNFREGVRQIIEALDIGDFFPGDIHDVLEALCIYRNHTFHWGTEWLSKDRREFAAIIGKCQWQNWFVWATSGGEPWIVYLTDAFVDHCVETIGHTAKAFDRIRERWLGLATFSLSGP